MGDKMKDLLWALFKNTGKVEYYLKYKEQEHGSNDRKDV